MNPKIAEYPNGLKIPYDADAPCHWCGFPVVSASMGGTACCPWCDLGICRFDRSHRVDMEGFNPETGKFYAPSTHYQRHHADEWTKRIPEATP